MNDKRQKIVIAGASGFVGKNLIQYLLDTTNHDLVGLSRFPQQSQHPRLSFLTCDLFSLLEVEECLKGADAAYYLVHSMLPSANLDQGHFYDNDLLLADNFSRAARKANLKQVIYLGGIVPPMQKLSWHLKSRLEVEQVLSQNTFALTALRAGLIVGTNGSSFLIMQNLVKRLPLMLCPLWTQNQMTPIDVKDIVKILTETLLNEKYFNQIYDVKGMQPITYLDMMRTLARSLGLRRYFLSVPVSFITFSKLWVRLITGAKKELVYPLLDSVRYSMVTDAKKEFKLHFIPMTLEQSFKEAQILTEKRLTKTFVKKENPYVRSVQRLILPKGMNAQDVALEYMKWLPKFMFPIFFVSTKNDLVTFAMLHPKIHLLYLQYSKERSTPDRSLFYVTGGLLAKPSPKARLEFRETLNQKYIITGIHDFVPTLPWPIYRCTQALVHLWVTYSFGKHLVRLKERSA